MDIGQDLLLKGYWWLPGSSSAKVYGELQCLRDGHVRLSLSGSLAGIAAVSQGGVSIPVILGVSEDGRFLTLLENPLTHWTLRLPGIPEEQYLTTFLLIGAHFQDPSALRFTAVTLRTLGIDEWIGITGFNVETDPKAKRCSVVFQKPERREYTIDPERKLAVVFSCQIPLASKPIRRVSIEQRTSLQVVYSQAQPLHQLLADVKKIGDLLTLGIGKPVAVTAVSLSVARDEGAEDEDACDKRRAIELYYQSLPGPQDRFEVYSSEMTFAWKDIEPECGTILAKWFDLYDQIAPALNWYFAIQYRTDLYLESQFLAMVQSLEALHRRLFPNDVESQDQHRQRVERILHALEEPDRSWLEPRLQYANEPTLRQRLEQLIQPSQALFKSGRQKQSFINSIVATRNYLTHYDQGLRKSSLEGPSMYEAVEKLRLLFTIQILCLLGFEHQQALDMIGRNPRWKGWLEKGTG